MWGRDVGERFTERARTAILRAREEAGRHGHTGVGTEHLLLGVLRDGESVAVHVLARLGVSRERAISEIERHIAVTNGARLSDIALTLEAKHAIDLAHEEADRLGSDFVGTEHLLLGLLREGHGTAAYVLKKLGAQVHAAEQLVANSQGVQENIGTSIQANLSVQKSNQEARNIFMKGRDLLSIRDLSAKEVWEIFRIAREMKSRSPEEELRSPMLPGKTLAMIFEKPSLRTRVTFEVGMNQLGGHAVYLAPQDIQMGKRETVPDVARNLSRWVDGIMARVFSHQTVVDLARYATVPVINGLSDLEHPCQALADVFTIYEKKGNLRGLKIAYIGDGCNTCHSLMLLAAKVGADIVVSCPEGYEPDTAILTSARRDAKESGSKIEIVNDPFAAATGADVIYTDVWASMGLEAEAEQRRHAFQRFQVNQQLVETAAEDVIVLHCLPAHRGEEITDEVIDGPRSVVLDEAENRLHVQKAVMALLM